MRVARGLALGCLLLWCAAFAGGFASEAAAQAKPEGEMRWALYVTLSAAWLVHGQLEVKMGGARD